MVLDSYDEQLNNEKIKGVEFPTYLELLCELNCELSRRGIRQHRTRILVCLSCLKLTKHRNGAKKPEHVHVCFDEPDGAGVCLCLDCFP